MSALVIAKLILVLLDCVSIAVVVAHHRRLSPSLLFAVVRIELLKNRRDVCSNIKAWWLYCRTILEYRIFSYLICAYRTVVEECKLNKRD